MKKIIGITILVVNFIIVKPIYIIIDTITNIFSFIGNKISDYVLYIVKKYKIRIR
jgi:hypothetical protein